MKHLQLLILSLLPMALWAQEWANNSVLREGSWYKIGVEASGVYRLSPNELPALQGLPFSQIALYSGHARQIDEALGDDYTDDLRPHAYKAVDENHNGIVDATDCLLFYAEGATTWRWDDSQQRYLHQRHAYDQRNYLFLRTDAEAPLQISSAPQLAANQPDVNTFTLCGLYEEENLNTHNSGQVWVSEKFLNGTAKSFTVGMPPLGSSSLQARLALAAPEGNGRFIVACGNRQQEFSLSNNQDYNIFATLFDGHSTTFDLTFTSSNGANGYLDYIELNAVSTATFGSSALLLHSSQGLGEGHVARMVVGLSGEVPTVWEVTRPHLASEIPTKSDNATVSFTAAADQPRDFILFTTAQALTPASVNTLPNQNLHAASTPDLLIVTHPQLIDQAQRLALLHETMDGMEVMVATQDQVFNEFSSGKCDPMALRNLLRKMSAGERQPHHLLLFGKGTYDNRDLLGKGFTTVVTYQNPESFNTNSQHSASDDIYGPYSIGRLPAKNPEEASRLVDKIERYMLRIDLEDNTARGDWRTYVTLLSDDADPSQAGDVEFVTSSEYLAQQIETQNPWINLDKIYADAYQQQSGTIGSYYPDVNNALKQRMDYGCLLLNYIGHGSDQYIGTERYMEQADIENYRNFDRLPFFVTSTCSFGKFDKIDGECGSEAFVLAQGAGVGCVAAARPISHIRAFNTCLATASLNPTNTIGDALRMAKERYPMAQNVAITLMGDPALKLCFPEHEVVVTAINGKGVEEGVCDSALVLSRVTIEGEIRNQNGQLQSDFNGIIYPIVFDRKQACRTLANDNEGTEVDFAQQKSILYKGCDTVMGGRFSYSFIVPRDVAYQYGAARLSHYAKSTALGSDAAGAYNQLMLGGFDESVDISESRPEIRLFMGDTTFLPGGTTDPDATLLALLRDSIGINAVGAGLGHDITALLDDNASDILILNDFYETDVADPTLGHIRYQFTNLAPGHHTLTLKAWNIFNYSSSATLDFVVRGSDSLAIASVRPYPNPTHDGRVTLNVNHNCPDHIAEAYIEVFDLWGHRVARLSPTLADGSYSFSATCNLQGKPNGLYLARAVIVTDEGATLSETAKIVKK